MLNGDTAVEAGSCMTARGTINCDVEKKVYFASDSTETDAYALGSSEKTAGYSKTDNIIECGRRYVLTEESIQKAFC